MDDHEKPADQTTSPHDPDTETDHSSGDRRARTRRIGLRLQQFYDEVAQEEIPDDFLRLLEGAEKESSRTSKSSKNR